MKRRITRYREHKLACAERERLEKAYQDALQEKHSVEDDLDREVVSVERSKARRAKNQREEALGHAIHILNELTAHQRKHGCLQRTRDDQVASIEKD
jgi:hypothetical protein